MNSPLAMPGLADRTGPDLDAAFAICMAQVRALDPDRYLACLFAPREAQPGLFALYAFSSEIARIRDVVSEPMPGELRHQWWREALSCKGEEAGRQNPVALAILDTLRRYALPPEPLLALIEARSFDLYDDPMPTWQDLEGYCGETSSALVRLATLILAGGEEPGSADLCGYAGVSYAMTGLLRAFPIHARRRQCFLPHEMLISCGVSLEEIAEGKDSDNLRAALHEVRQRARGHFETLRSRIGEIDARIRPAFLACCLVPAYLGKMERADYRPFETLVDLNPLRKWWIVGRSAWKAKRYR
ncbi:MAG: phytoene/squalene synthase family protein [Beijerinckiaceae bacterium]|nr:phytoene/squalene synthase family protein [Beijerinckiaceae bacterium]